MTAPRLTYLPDVLEEHLEELPFLWGLRERALRSPAYTMRELALLEERVEARAQGLLAVGDRALPLLDAALAGDDGAAAFAAAFALLRAGTEPAARRAVDAFAGAAGKRLDGLRRALCALPAPHAVAPVYAVWCAAAAPSLAAAAAAEVLVLQSTFRPDGARVEQMLRDERPAVRAAGWRVVAAIGADVAVATLGAGMCDEDAAVRQAAVEAAAWTARPNLLAFARYAADAADAERADLLYALAVLGDQSDLARVTALAGRVELGPLRLRVAGAFGHPALVPLVLAETTSADPATAAAAGDAFLKLTGHDVASLRTAPAASPADPFEAEFVDEVRLPDPALAREVWARVGGEQSRAGRLCRGLDVAAPLGAEAVARLDLESRREFFVRARYRGVWQGTPAQLTAFPQAR